MPTLNKKTQDCSVIYKPLKNRLSDIFGTAGFPAKVYLWALREHFLCNVVSDVFGQHWLKNILTQCFSSMVDTTLYRLSSNIPHVISLGNVGLDRSSHQKCSARKGVLKYFTKFTEKHLYQSLFLNKVAGLRPATLLKKSLWHRCFHVSFAIF